MGIDLTSVAAGNSGLDDVITIVLFSLLFSDCMKFYIFYLTAAVIN